MKSNILFTLIIAATMSGCTASGGHSTPSADTVITTQNIPKDTIKPLKVAAEDTASYLPLLRGKKVALTANPTAQAFGKHLLDVMIEGGVNVQKVFAPEHGFRGAAEPG
jgi:uncharacterized protein YbbC (DUF1343 family)